MTYEAKVYRILIASPSDVEEERDITVRVIQEWNDLHSYSRKIVLLPLRWETHVAPEYDVRPQDVINKTIVNQCDLVIGIFWTRLGTPTGKSDSGTLEEIQETAKAGKPVMIYFSEREIEPERIDLEQLKKLRDLKKEVYSNAIVKTYRSYSDFREKLANDLERKIKEIHEKNERNNDFFKFGVFSIEDERITDHYEYEIERLSIINIDKLTPEQKNRLQNLIDSYIDSHSYYPLIFAIENQTSTSLQYLYIEAEITSESNEVIITDSIQDQFSTFVTWKYSIEDNINPITRKVNDIISRYKPTKLYKKENNWKIGFEIEVLQPQRLQILEPVLYIKVKGAQPSSLLIKSKIYTDLFLKPYEFHFRLLINVKEQQIKYEDLKSDWIKYVEGDG